MRIFQRMKSKVIKTALSKEAVIRMQENRIALLESKLNTANKSCDLGKQLIEKYNSLFENELILLREEAELEQKRNLAIECKFEKEVNEYEHSMKVEREAYEERIRELELIITSLEGNLGHPVPDGVDLPNALDNVLADQLKKQLDAAREVIEKVEGGNKKTAYENMQCRAFLFDLEDFLLPDHPAKKMVKEFISHVGWNKN